MIVDDNPPNQALRPGSVGRYLPLDQLDLDLEALSCACSSELLDREVVDLIERTVGGCGVSHEASFHSATGWSRLCWFI